MIAAQVVLPWLLLGGMLAAGPGNNNGRQNIRETLEGLQEVPAVSTTGVAEFRARIDEDGEMITWELRYADLEGDVAQAHIHFGQAGVNGGISVFLCTNLGNGPAGTQPCPPSPARIEGFITPVDVIGPAAQGISPGEFDELVRAIRARSTYVNVHSSLWPGGEVRGQIAPPARNR
ncbi:MAG TPA: CHRD domain-containing protein [Thermoanaerobaculia bacterium]|nr:CHRD domain-containing protein [Thermoanaerobaculia bacterium]